MNFKEIENGVLNERVYLLSGDRFLIKKAVGSIAKKLDVQSINISQFNAENFDCISAINACNQFSFFNEKRLVVVDALEKELVTSDKNLLLSYIKNPNEDCYLLLENNNGVFDFLKNITTIECKLNESSTLNYIKTKFEENGKNATSEAIKVINEFCLGNFNRIVLEIQKICDYLGNEKLVTEEIVKELVFKDTELKVFDLTVALSNKNKEKSHKLLYDMLKAGEPPIKILGLISNHFRRLFFAKINKDSNAELAKMLGCKEFAITKAKQEAVKYTAKQLKTIQELILETDYNIKSGVMSQENALYYLIFAIVNI